MKKIILSACLFFIPFFIFETSAQKIGKKVKEKAKQTAEQKAEQKTEEGVSQGVDKGIEGIKSIFNKRSKDSNDGSDDEDSKDAGDATDPGSGDPDTSIFGVYSKFTFEPGNKILFYDDFEKDGLGDFPTKWETSGTGEVVANSVYPGKWLSLSGRSGYLPSSGELPENYTVEFDLITNGFTNNNSGNALMVAFIKKKSYRMGSAGGHADLRISLHKTAALTIANTGAEKSPRISTKLDQKFKLDALVHISVAVNKNRLRIWMDEEKIVDIPSLLIGNMGRYILFEAFDINPAKGHAVLISNFKIAESTEDLRSQLLDKGRFSTTGIYFNTDKAEIKPESYAVLKSVADYLRENSDVNIQVIGHTDSQGELEYNLNLSERRAQAVISALVHQFNIKENRLSATGMGEAKPVDDNTSEKGRANNRRVEFVKM